MYKLSFNFNDKYKINIIKNLEWVCFEILYVLNIVNNLLCFILVSV